MKLTLALVMVPLALTACATPETRVRTALLDAGLSQPVAGCMADRMANRLSYGQLMKLASLGKLQGRRVGDMRIKDLIQNLRSIDDPEIVRVVSRAALGCAIAG